MLLTAADSSHFRPLLNLLACMGRHEPKQRAVVYDLGLTAAERDSVRAEVRPFPFNDFPAHVRNLKIYAWKPLAIRAALADGEPLIWHDAGNLFHQPLTPIWESVNEHGFFMPDSGRAIRDFTHPAMLETHARDIADRPMRHASLIGVSSMRMRIARAAARWALDEKAFAPPGHSRRNHLYDQPIYSILAERAGIKAGEWHSVTRGNDNLTAGQAAACLDSPRPW